MLGYAQQVEDILANPLVEDYERRNALLRVYREIGDSGLEGFRQRLGYLIVAFQACWSLNGCNGHAWGPLAWDSAGRAAPDLLALDDEAWEVFRAEAETSANATVRARCADLLWDYRKDHSMARVALAAYAELVSSFTTAIESREKDVDVGDAGGLLQVACRRLLAISLSLRGDHVASVEDAVVGSAKASLLLARRGYVPLACDIIAAALEAATKDEKEELPSQLTSSLQEIVRIARDAPVDGVYWDRLRCALPTLQRLHLATAAEDKAAETGLEYARTYADQGEWMLQQGAAKNTVLGYYRDCVAELKRLNRPDNECGEYLRRIDELLPAARAEMTAVVHTMTVPREQVEVAREAILRSANENGFRFMADPALLLDPEGLLRNARAELSEFPLLSLISREVLSEDGIVARSGGREDAEKWRMTESLRTWLTHVLPQYVHWGVTHIVLQRGLGYRDASEQLRECNVIQSWRKDLLEAALERYFATDLTSFIHIAVPQIEGILRDMVSVRGEPVTRPTGHGPDLTTPLRTLDALLHDPTVISTIGEALALALRVILTDAEGLNLRHRLCHAFLRPDDVNLVYANLVLFSLFQLADFRVEVDEPGSHPESHAASQT